MTSVSSMSARPFPFWRHKSALPSERSKPPFFLFWGNITAGWETKARQNPIFAAYGKDVMLILTLWWQHGPGGHPVGRSDRLRLTCRRYGKEFHIFPAGLGLAQRRLCPPWLPCFLFSRIFIFCRESPSLVLRKQSGRGHVKGVGACGFLCKAFSLTRLPGRSFTSRRR